MYMINVPYISPYFLPSRPVMVFSPLNSAGPGRSLMSSRNDSRCQRTLGILGSQVMGVPQNGWRVYFMENPNRKWMRTGVAPIFRKTPFNEDQPK